MTEDTYEEVQSALEQPESPPESQTPEPEFDDPVEKVAAEIGWRPDGEKTAAEYIRDSREIQKRQRVSNEKLNEELKQTRDMVDRIARQFDDMDKRARERAMKELEQRGREAFESGDYEGFRQVEQQRERLQHHPEPQRPSVTPDVQQFIERNTWFESDPVLRAAAIRYDEDMKLANPNMPEGDRLKQVEAEVRAAYPHKFRATKPSADTDTRPPGARQSGRQKGFNDLPPEAQGIALKLEKQGLSNRDEFAKNYWKDEK